MDALSPRSANIQLKARVMKQKEVTDEEAKKVEAAKKALKEKEYAPPPPEWVFQPPISNGGLAEKFRTGRCLGKGGFAICYEGELRNKKTGKDKQVFALKIVRTVMGQRKMEEKACIMLISWEAQRC
ncbi:Cell cycle serine/threonine-protein kinase cdc5/MSD2 [Mycoblastus sanguinarius]|nr:Cell cycle serine/threonine-protein kinase cdc5/MSD2 [Mycoblastus sanguinarius]